MLENPVTVTEKLKILNMMYGKAIGTNEGEVIISGINTHVINNDNGKLSLSENHADHKVHLWFTRKMNSVREARLSEIDIYKGNGWQIRFIKKDETNN